MYSPVEPFRLYVIVPAFREEKTVGNVVDDLLANGYTVVVVDDGSPNSLAPVLKNKAVYFLRHTVNLGQGAALQSGIAFALEKGATHIATFDADAQHKAADVERLLQVMQQKNVDVVLGSRFLSAATTTMPPSRRRLLQLARLVNYFFTGLYLTDAHNGLRLLNRHAAECIVIRENRMAHATEILSQIKANRLRYTEAPVDILYTEYSLQKGQSFGNSFRILVDLLLHKIFQ